MISRRKLCLMKYCLVANLLYSSYLTVDVVDEEHLGMNERLPERPGLAVEKVDTVRVGLLERHPHVVLRRGAPGEVDATVAGDEDDKVLEAALERQ